MANDNETVEQVCEEFGELCEGVHVNSFGYIEDMTQTDACNFINDILVAHKRELAAVSAERDEWQKQALEENAALDVARAELTAKDAEIAGLMDSVYRLLKNEESLGRQKVKMERELTAKDAEIARLKSCLAGDCERMRLGAEPCEGCHIERINERNEIIKELADALWDENGPSYRKLIAKAREVCK